MQNRAKRIFSYVGEDVDAVIFMNDEEPNVDAMFPYVTGTTGGLFESCLAVAWPDGRVELLTNVLEETSARLSWSEVWVFQNRADKEKQIKRMLGKTKRIGVNAHGLSYSNLLDLKMILPQAIFIDVGKGLLAARLIKDKDEMERLRKACQIVTRVADEIPSFIKPGMTEYEAAAEINYRMQRYGASGPSFGTNASFGDNSAEPHHEPDERKCRKNDVALFDFGALYRKYGSDLTRTFFVGKATGQQKRMYQVVLEAQLAALAEIKPGMNGKDIDADKMKQCFATTNYKEFKEMNNLENKFCIFMVDQNGRVITIDGKMGFGQDNHPSNAAGGTELVKTLPDGRQA
jgi:Xaa-Pro aminopeptidase